MTLSQKSSSWAPMGEVCIVFPDSSPLETTLRCTLLGIQGRRLEGGPPPKKMRSMRIITQVSDIGNDPWMMLKSQPSEMDMTTLHTLLMTMKGALVLQDIQDDARQFLWQPNSLTTAIFSEYIPSNAPGEPREITTSTTSLDATLAAIPCTDYQPPPWVAVLRGIQPFSIHPNFQEAYRDCIKTGNPTPVELVTRMFPWYLAAEEKGDSHDDQFDWKAKLDEWIRGPKNVLRFPPKSDTTATSLFEWQVQCLLRLQCLAMGAEPDFVLALREQQPPPATNMKKRRRQRLETTRRDTPEQIFLNDMINLLSQVAFALPVNRPFSIFLQELIPESIYASIPNVVDEIYDFFEVPNPHLESDNESDVMESVAATVPATAESHAGALQLKEVAKLETKPPKAATVPLVDQDSWMRQSIQLTAPPKSNPLLRNSQKSRYVASHFNTKLANISNLFRQVDAAPKPAPMARGTLTHGSKRCLSSTENCRQPLVRPRTASLQSTSHPMPQRVVSETPCKRPRSATATNRYGHSSMPTSPHRSATSHSMPQRVVSETPSKKPRSATTTNRYRSSPNTTSPHRSARLVAQAALAAARRKL